MKILIIGHGRHGKDTTAGLIKKNYGLSFESSSQAASDIFLFDKLKNIYGYTSSEQCYKDRHSEGMRKVWFDEIEAYNTPDPSRLARAILNRCDMYIGMRSIKEFNASRLLFDLVLGVFDPRKPLESKDSFKIDLFNASDILLINNSSISELERKIKLLKLN